MAISRNFQKLRINKNFILFLCPIFEKQQGICSIYYGIPLSESDGCSIIKKFIQES